MTGNHHTPSRTARHTRALAPVLLLALAAPLAACSSNNTPSTSSNSSSPSASAMDTAAASASVKQTWTTFFDKSTPISQKETLLQNGTTTFAPAVQAFAHNPMVGQVTATVSNVTFPSPTKADVTYSISLNGQVVESSMAGGAVYQNGQWLVSDTTLCGLLQLAATQSGGGSTAIPGCS